MYFVLKNTKNVWLHLKPHRDSVSDIKFRILNIFDKFYIAWLYLDRGSCENIDCGVRLVSGHPNDWSSSNGIDGFLVSVFVGEICCAHKFRCSYGLIRFVYQAGHVFVLALRETVPMRMQCLAQSVSTIKYDLMLLNVHCALLLLLVSFVIYSKIIVK